MAGDFPLPAVRARVRAGSGKSSHYPFQREHQHHPAHLREREGFFRRQGIDLQFRVLRGFLRSLKAVQEDKKEVVEFIARKFALDAATAAETHRVVLRTLSDDGTVGDSALKDLLEQTKQETGVKKDINARDIVDDSLVRQRHKERRQGIRSELSQRGLFIH